MAQPSVIPVPKTDPGAFNPKRPGGKLLQAQVLHLREALIKHLHELAALLAIDVRALHTEGELSDYISKVTAVLHPDGAKRKRK